MSSKPHINTKLLPILNQAQNFINNSDLFGRGGGFTGGNNLADTKHSKLWQDFGYPETVEFYMHWNMWRRNGLARRGAKLPVDVCWLSCPEVKQIGEHLEPTPFESAIDALNRRLSFDHVMRNADLCQRIGRYGAILVTVADGKTREQPLDIVRPDQIVKLTPLFEGQLTPSDIDQSRDSARFGLPTTYTYQSNNVGGRDSRSSDAGLIHYSRLIVITEDGFGDDIYGIPCNEAGFNALLNWQKTQGSGAEGFWRAAAQRFVLQATGGTESQDFSSEELSDLSDMIAKMFSGFDAIPSLGNYEMKGLNVGTMSDPTGFRQMQLEEYSASMGIPSKMLVGSQTGVKAADEDSSGFMREMQSRRENVISQWVNDWINWIDLHTTIDTPESGYEVEWDDLTAPGADQKMALAKEMAAINKTQVDAGDTKPFHAQEIREVAGFEQVDQLGDWDDGLLIESDFDVPTDESA